QPVPQPPAGSRRAGPAVRAPQPGVHRRPALVAAGRPHLRQATGFPDPDYSCTTEDGRAILTAAVPEPAAFAFLCQEIFADDYHDRTVTFRGDLRTTGVADRAGLL